jgi:hypothetical protein
MMRLAAAVFVVVLAGFPVAVMPGPPVTWLAGVALVAAGAGVLVLSVTLVTVGGSIALIAYAVARLIVRSPIDPVAAAGFGATLVLVLALVHFAGRVDGAVLGPAVVATQVRHWLAVVATGVAAAAALTAGAAALGAALAGTTLPLVVVAAALGALLAVGGVIALTTRGEPPPPS